MNSRHFSNIASVFIVMMVLSCLSGCGANDEMTDLQESTSKTKQDAIDEAKKIHIQSPQLPKRIRYEYAHLRAPFAKRHEAVKSSVNIAATPLQAYPISVLTLVGTISEDGNTFAYVSAPDQMIYRLDEGDIIGEKKGKVINISPGRVDVVVLETEEGQAPVQRKIVLELKDEP